MALHIKFRKRKELKKELSEELMPVAWHPDRWWDWSEDEKKEIDPMFIEQLQKYVSVVYNKGYMYFGTFILKDILVIA